MRMLLAGGAGFVGSFLTERALELGHDVVVLDNLITGRRENLSAAHAMTGRGRLSFVEADAAIPSSLGGRFDCVLHLASPASPVDYFRLPIETLECGSSVTRTLLDLARRHGARFLLASTSEVYGDPSVHPQREDYWGNVNPIGPRAVYDEAKRFAEAMASAYARTFGVQVRIARIFNTYGPRMRIDDGRIIPTFVRQALLGEAIPIHGDGRQTRSYCYVEDLVEGLLRLLWSEVEGPVNLGNPAERTVLETAAIIRQAAGSLSPLAFYPAQEDDPRQRCPDISRAEKLLGWAPRTAFEDGLKLVVEDVARQISDGDSGWRRSAVGP